MRYLKDGLKTFSLLMVFTLISYIYFELSNNTNNVAVVYMLYVFFVARFTSSYLWSSIASIAGMLGVNYMFTYPYFALNFTLSGYPVTFIGMLTVAIVTATLTAHSRQQAAIKSIRESCLNKLNEINKQLIIAETTSKIIELTLNYVVGTAQISCIFYTTDPVTVDSITPSKPIMLLTHPDDEFIFSSSYEQALAHLAYVSSKPVGTDFHSSDSQCLYLPVVSHNHTWGILGLLRTENPSFIQDNLQFLTLMLPQMALAFERQNLSEEHHQMAIDSEKEKMRANLLRAVSHDLRTPLTGMIGASSTYIENQELLNEQEKLQLVIQIYEDSNWLLHMVENLLSVTRIVEKTAKVIKVPELLEEVISEAINRVKKRYPNASIEVIVPNEMLIVPMDATLIEQVIINLVENAIKHSQSVDSIKVIAIKEPDTVRIDIIDNGVGISYDKLDTLFDGNSLDTNNSSDSTKGMGIGLSICKTIISAHSGTIRAKNLIKGTLFTFSLPLEEAT